jgi:membrane-associated protease RseP (regulator of RpoE activity)
MQALYYLLANATLAILSLYVINFAHELGHLAVGNLVGIPIRKLFLSVKHPSKGGGLTVKLFGFILGVGLPSTRSHSYVLMSVYQLNRLSPRRRLALFLAGPYCGIIAPIAWGITAYYALGLKFQVLVGCIWLWVNIGGLGSTPPPLGEQYGGSDGWNIAQAKRELTERA